VGVEPLFPECQVLGVSVARDKERGSASVIESANELISALDKSSVAPIENVYFDDGFMGLGYESAYPVLVEVIDLGAREEGLILDPTYSGKAFLALVTYIKTGRIPIGSNVVFWHTGGLINLLASEKL